MKSKITFSLQELNLLIEQIVFVHAILLNEKLKKYSYLIIFILKKEVIV